MKNPTIHRRLVAYGSALLFIGATCIAPPLALTQSPADGQTPGAAINSTRDEHDSEPCRPIGQRGWHEGRPASRHR
jgi:hypothetical protein